MGDSESYDILSQERLDSLKQDLSATSGRITTLRRELALETRVRDAARSVNRLPSISGNKGRGSDAGRNSEEVTQSAKKCEELDAEIIKLEKDEYRLQKSLLEHTAGVLQLTHKGYLKKEPTAEHVRTGHHIPGLDLDGEFGGLGQYTLYKDVLSNELNGEQPTAELADQHQMILSVERRVEELNARLRDMILELKPQKMTLPQPPRLLGDDPNDLGEILFDQVDFLAKCLETVHSLQNSRGDTLGAKSAKQSQLFLDVESRMEDLNNILRGIILDLKPRKEELPDPARELRDDPDNPEIILTEQVGFLEACLTSLQTLLQEKRDAGDFELPEDKLGLLNGKLFDLMTHNDPERASKYFPPPQPDGTTMFDQFEYLEQGLKAVDRRMGELGDFEDTAAEKLASYQNRAEQYVSVIGGLWDILRAEELELATQAGRSPPQDNFSLQAFSKKVQELHANHLEMMDQKEVLTRQIQQQRDLGTTADNTKDKRMNIMRDENNALKSQLDTVSAEAAVHLEKLTLTTAELQSAKNMLAMRDEQAGRGNSRVLDEEKNSRRLAEEQLTAQTVLAVKAENAVKELESTVARLQTELTIAQADLDSAHGTRAQRAAEAAADPALQARVQMLQKELSEMTADYESMTKASIEYEKERDRLESAADGLRDRVGELEGQLAEERINGMGVKSPGMESVRSVGAGGGTSVSVLKAEFKKMTRELREGHRKAMSVSLASVFLARRIANSFLQAKDSRIRDLEAELRAQKKGGGARGARFGTRV